MSGEEEIRRLGFFVKK